MKLARPSSWQRRLRWQIVLLFGALCALFGAVVIFRPFTSLAALIVLVSIGMIATGVASFGNARAGEWLPRLAGAAWIALGVAVMAWPELSTRGLALSVGVALIVAGVIDVAQGLRGTTDERIAAAIGGAASATFGVLALAWPDVTLLVVAIVFGARMVVFGLRLAWMRSGPRRCRPRSRCAPVRVRRVGHILVAIVASSRRSVSGASAQISATDNQSSTRSTPPPTTCPITRECCCAASRTPAISPTTHARGESCTRPHATTATLRSPAESSSSRHNPASNRYQ